LHRVQIYQIFWGNHELDGRALQKSSILVLGKNEMKFFVCVMRK